jgi:metallophosphoesterase superfamily enzyme
VLGHVPFQPDSGYGLSGHLHPGIELKGRGRQLLRVPCFWFGTRCAVLPAFGSFTGISLVRPQPDDSIYATTGESVLRIAPPVDPRPDLQR